MIYTVGYVISADRTIRGTYIFRALDCTEVYAFASACFCFYYRRSQSACNDNDHTSRALHVVLGGTVSKTKRNVTIHSLINIVIIINGYMYSVRHEATLLYNAVSETDSYICIFQSNVNIRIKE
jgi:signal-transduction protein with cAMP-binding, CBS, and nucleotidyltransferase domain